MASEEIFKKEGDGNISLESGADDQCKNPSEVCGAANNEASSEAMDTENRNDDGEMMPDLHNKKRMDNNMRMMFPTPRSAPSLTLEMVQEVNEQFKIPANEERLGPFADRNWLNDSNIDAYLELIKLRNQANENYPRIFRFHCSFYTLLKNRHVKEGGYESVKNCAVGDDIFSYDLVFFPCEIDRHWRTVVMDNVAKTLLLYDSLNSESVNFNCLKIIAMYLKREYERLLIEKNPILTPNGEPDNPDQAGLKKKAVMGINRKVKEFFDSNIWTVKIVDPNDIPRQCNSDDCGVFLLQYAEYLSRRMTFDFTQVHMPYFRHRMAYETITGKLMID